MIMLNLLYFAVFYFMLFLSVFWIIVFLFNNNALYIEPVNKKKYKISVLIPAYNEEKTISKTINSIFKQNYPKKLVQIIVINDGSTDNTKKICEEYERKGKILLINKKNGGKANALNVGLKKSQGELIYVIDSDSYAEKKSFKNLVNFFENEKVGAVISKICVNNNGQNFEKIQKLEYLVVCMTRKLTSLFNGLMVTPGAGSIFRKKALIEVKGFSEKSMTEDMEIALKLHKAEYRIENSMKSVCFTDVPITLSSFFKQRVRWYVGFIEDLIEHKDLFFNKKNTFLSKIVIPMNIFINLSVIFLLFLLFLNVGKEISLSLHNFSLINYDLSIILKFPSIYDFFLKTNHLSIFFAISVIFGFLILKISSYATKEKIDYKNNILSFIIYFFLISIINSFIVLDSIFYKIFLRKEKIGWRYGKKN